MSVPPPPFDFPSPFVFRARDPVTLVELRMYQFSGNIREKPRWWEKVHDATIVSKWRQEIVDQDRAMVDELWGGEKRFEDGDDAKKWPRDYITDAQLDYIFDQLRYDAGRRDEETGIYVSSLHFNLCSPSHGRLSRLRSGACTSRATLFLQTSRPISYEASLSSSPSQRKRKIGTQGRTNKFSISSILLCTASASRRRTCLIAPAGSSDSSP